MVPKESPPPASANSPASSQSKPRRASSSRLSGRCTSAAYSATTTSGTLIRNTARQLIVSTRRPPTNGPPSVSSVVPAAQSPYARPCWSPSKLTRRRARDPGTVEEDDAGAEDRGHQHPATAGVGELSGRSDRARGATHSGHQRSSARYFGP